MSNKADDKTTEDKGSDKGTPATKLLDPTAATGERRPAGTYVKYPILVATSEGQKVLPVGHKLVKGDLDSKDTKRFDGRSVEVLR